MMSEREYSFRKPIQHIVQEDDKGCVIACVAMILGAQYQQAKRLLLEASGQPELSLSGGVDLSLVLALFRRREDLFYIEYGHAAMVPGRVYYCGVPSLNIPGAMHAVVVDYRDPDFFTVHDPNLGRDGSRKVYDHRPDYTGRQEREHMVAYTEVVELFDDV